MDDSRLRDDPALQDYRAEAAEYLDEYDALIFRHEGTFRDQYGGAWKVRFKVNDPAKISPRAIAAAEAAARQFEVPFRDLRILTVAPTDDLPAIGAAIRFRDALGGLEGDLEILEWSQRSDYTDLARATCVLRH